MTTKLINTIRSGIICYHQTSAILQASRTPTYYTISRNYARNKDKVKEKKGGKVEINTLQMSELIDVRKLKDQCQRSIDKMKEDFVKHLSLRSAVGSIESLKIKYEGKDYELQELAQIIRKNPKTIVINLATFPQVIPEVLKTIQVSGLNLNPQQDGTTLYVPVPKVTKEHRESLAKNAKTLYITCRDGVKDVQNDYLKKIKKQPKVSEDLSHSVQRQINALCDNYYLEAKALYQRKVEELIGK